MDAKLIEKDLYLEIKDLIIKARESIIKTINSTLVLTYWNIGKLIVEKQNGNERAKYGEKFIKTISIQLTEEFGAGFSERNIKYMRALFLCFPIRQTLSAELSWSHYLELIKVEDERARKWYFDESIKSNWNIRQLRRQIYLKAYYRILEHKELIDIDTPIMLEDSNPKKIIKDPYYLDFLGIKPSALFQEKDIEQALMTNLTQFLLELGRGFTFCSRQKRMLIDGDELIVDLVFFNVTLNCYILIDLKRGKLSHQDIGQMLTYVGYYDHEIKTETQNPTIGLILCEGKNDTLVKYALSGVVKPIFASVYELVLPTEEEFRKILNSQRALLEE